MQLRSAVVPATLFRALTVQLNIFGGTRLAFPKTTRLRKRVTLVYLAGLVTVFVSIYILVIIIGAVVTLRRTSAKLPLS